MKNFLPIFVVVILFSACEWLKPKPLAGLPVTEEKLAQIFTDLQIAEVALESENKIIKDSFSKNYSEQILQKYSVTKKDVDSSIVILTKNPPRLNRLYEEVLRNLKKKEGK